MKVKYLGNQGIYYHHMEWHVGDIKEVASDLFFPSESFEVLDVIETKPAKKVTKSKDL